MPASEGTLGPDTIKILALCAEGGGVCLFGRIESGNWRYFASHVDQTPTFLAGEDMGEEIRGCTSSVTSWDAALKMLDQHFKYWPRLSPIEVHPEFRAQFLEAIRARGGDDAAKKWADRIDSRDRIIQQRRSKPGNTQ